MDLRHAHEIPEHLAWLDRPADLVAGKVKQVLPPGPLKDALSGSWLGHALHPVLTDVPIGCWTNAFFFDLMPWSRRARTAADALIALGIAAAVPTAATGLSDWVDTKGSTRRVGTTHAALNSVALVLYIASLRARRKGSRARGIALAMVGAGVVTVSAALGGHLVYNLGVGVRTTAFDDELGDWTDVAAEAELVEGAPVQVLAGEVPVLLLRRGGAIHALADRCTHRGGPLHEGEVAGGCVVCPWHMSAFRLEDGVLERGPSTYDQPVFDVRIEAGRVLVRSKSTAA